jgi:ribosomal protein S18 acetylase RimI-like enzyme
MAVTLRGVEETDISSMAEIRAREWGTQVFWVDRIGRYLSGQHSPQQALAARTAFVAIEGNDVVGFVAGHRTRRFGFDGELQWINVVPEKRGYGIADLLIVEIAAWFVGQGARRICVNVDPSNVTARRLYARHGAQVLNAHWMKWEDAAAMCRSAGV